jgi:phospholipid/cholesterol/gamma-HCH transport system substrate-binding protein
VKRIAVGILLALAAAVVVTAGTGAGGNSSGDYKVRAIFDNAVSVIQGEDVKIAGVKVGRIDSLDVTPQKKAAVVLDVTRPGFQDFRQDATCTIRPQSLIGEKFVECTPTQPKPVGATQSPPLPKIKHGAGKGQHLLPVTQTSTPVDIDLINDVLRRPYAERLSIILGELGTGVAGQGAGLNETIRRANPALLQTDRVLKILAGQNQILATLASDSDTVLGPLARERQSVADQFAQANTVASATAERGADLERVLARLPTFLRQLRPTMVRLGGLSDQATPVLSDLGSQARSIDNLIVQLGPFSRAAVPALRTLGQAAAIGGPALVHSRPTIRDLRTFARSAKPVAANAAALLDSLQRTGGIERLMDYIFYQVAAINGFDQFGHYLRAALIVNLCTTYATNPTSGCSANFQRASGASARLSAAQRRELIANAAALGGNRPAAATTRGAVRARPRRRASGRAMAIPPIHLPGALERVLSGVSTGPAPARAPARGGPAAAPGPTAAAPPAPGSTPSDPRAGLLDYLLGPTS